MPDINELIDLSPPLGLLFAITIIIWCLKKAAPNFPGWLIPTIAFLLGGTIFPLITDPGKVPYQMRSPLTAEIMTGLLIGGAAVGGNQAVMKVLQKMGFFQDDYQPPKPPVNS